MHMMELAIWSAAAGAIALVILFGLLDFAMSRHVAALHGAAYNLACLFFVLLLSGVAHEVLPDVPDRVLSTATVLAGPLCVCLGDLWVRAWFSARHRDRLMDVCLMGAGIFVPAAALALVFVVPPTHQLSWTAGLVVANTGLMTWISVRAWLLGDRLALGIALGSLLMMPGVGGLYAIAMGAPLGVGWQAAIAISSTLCVAVIGFMLWQRNQHARRVRRNEDVQSQYDPVTKLPAGLPLVRQLIQAQKRRKLTRREGAVIAVIVFEPDRIKSQVGQAGVNEMYLHLAQRLQRQVGVVNPVGRYWDRCFVTLVEAIHSPSALRTLGLRVASTLRRPMQVSHEGNSVQVKVDIGVGVVYLGRDASHVEDLLHDAQQLAEAARGMPSRAATRDPVSGDVVPVEHAQLGPRRLAKPHAHGARTLPHGARGARA